MSSFVDSFIDSIELYYATHDFPKTPIASGKYLDNLGKILGVIRNKEECDNAYRKRISIAFDTRKA